MRKKVLISLLSLILTGCFNDDNAKIARQDADKALNEIANLKKELAKKNAELEYVSCFLKSNASAYQNIKPHFLPYGRGGFYSAERITEHAHASIQLERLIADSALSCVRKILENNPSLSSQPQK